MELTAVSLSCGRLGFCLARVSVKLDATFLSSKNANEAASRLVIVANEFKVLQDGHYVNVRPKAEVLAHMLQTQWAHELQQLQQPSAAVTLMAVVPVYPTTGSDQQASAIAVNTLKAKALDEVLQQLNIPGGCIIRQSTRCISAAVKTLLGQDTRAMAAGNWEKRQQLERDAVELFLQEGRRGSATAEVLQQFRVQDGRKNADARHDLAVVFWLAAAALMQKAEQLRLQHKGQQSQVKKQQLAAEKERRAAEKQRRAADAAPAAPVVAPPPGAGPPAAAPIAAPALLGPVLPTGQAAPVAGPAAAAAHGIMDLVADTSSSESFESNEEPDSPPAAGAATAQHAGQPHRQAGTTGAAAAGYKRGHAWQAGSQDEPIVIPDDDEPTTAAAAAAAAAAAEPPPAPRKQHCPRKKAKLAWPAELALAPDLSDDQGW
ncbi:hypothetical protein COO60DRAFT_570169 [Scenedesmus sp. NREL 46B-D3]|nr:hypothetical protein COO60DRAFT_570169 [Scenedesmus sp. NREL 46B-D3]